MAVFVAPKRNSHARVCTTGTRFVQNSSDFSIAVVARVNFILKKTNCTFFATKAKRLSLRKRFSYSGASSRFSPQKPTIRSRVQNQSINSQIKIVASSDSFEVLYGNSSSAIAAEKKIRDSKWLPTTPWESKSQTRIILSPFGNSCFGIVFTVSKETYYLVTTVQGK